MSPQLTPDQLPAPAEATFSCRFLPPHCCSAAKELILRYLLCASRGFPIWTLRCFFNVGIIVPVEGRRHAYVDTRNKRRLGHHDRTGRPGSCLLCPRSTDGSG